MLIHHEDNFPTQAKAPIVIRKHVVRVEYLDYGAHLDTVFRTATSVDGGRPVSDGPEYRTRGEAEAAVTAWLSEHSADARPAGITLERGEALERRTDMNPHGLV